MPYSDEQEHGAPEANDASYCPANRTKVPIYSLKHAAWIWPAPKNEVSHPSII